MGKNEELPLIQVNNLKKYYPVKSGIITHTTGQRKAVDGVDFSIRKGEIFGLVGESGCGKSTIGRTLIGLETSTEGTIFYRGKEISDTILKKERALRTKLQMVFQDPYSALNPRKRVFEILAQPMLYHGISTKKTAKKDVCRLLELVGLPESAMNRYPHEFSGGQRQRIGIARALSLKPEFIVCDEPVSALDVSVQAQILNLLKSLQKELNLTLLFVGHGLGAVHYVSDRIAVMYLGKLMEIGTANEVFHHPVHPYTKALLSAVPVPDPQQRRFESMTLDGEAESGSVSIMGCRFSPRCPYTKEICRQQEPFLMEVRAGAGHLAACPVMKQQGED